jgi:hypothetical protein
VDDLFRRPGGVPGWELVEEVDRSVFVRRLV